MFSNIKNDKEKILVAKLHQVDKDKIKSGNKLMLLVSVGKKNFNLEAMMSITKLLNEVQEERPPLMVTLNIADSLQRFNTDDVNIIDQYNDYSEQQLTMSIANGDEWIKSVEPALINLRCSKHIIRWEYWRSHQDYKTAYNKILNLEKNYSEEFKINMRVSINEYTERRKRFIGEERFNSLKEKVEASCEQYLREEITTMVLWKETGCNFILYPGKLTPIMALTLEKLIYPTNPELLQWLTIRLQRVCQNEAAKKQKMFFFMEEVIKSAPGHIYWKDNHGIYLGCNDNQAKTLGYASGEEIVGKTDFDLPWKQQAAFLREIDLKVMESKEPFFVEEAVFIDEQSEPRVFLSKKVPMQDDQGKSIGIIGISFDITDRKRVEQLQKENYALEKVSKLVKAISGGIAHEMRTPMSIVGINADNLSAIMKNLSCNNKNIIMDMLKNIKFAVKSGSHIVNMLLTKLHRAFCEENIDSQKKFPIESIKNTINEAIKEYPFYYNERDYITWDYKSNEDFIYKGDVIVIKQILFNLIKNALWAIKEADRGEIYIFLKKGAAFNYLVFKDTALGISSKVIGTLFEPFIKYRKNGTGLGLYFCKTSMQTFGGDITCDSKEGEYTEFTLSFPVTPTEG